MMNNTIKDHYASPGLLERIVQGLEAIGKSPATLNLNDLAAVDEFHLRGPEATQELIEILDVGVDSHVLDVGSGLGGPARRLANATGCRVTGVDLSEDYCSAGNTLTAGWDCRSAFASRWATRRGLSASLHLRSMPPGRFMSA